MNGLGFTTRSARYTSNGLARVSARNRWLSTTWKMSPALMYSTALRTAASNSGCVKFELTPAGKGTQLVLDHTGFPPGHYDHLYSGWGEHYWTPLKRYLGPVQR